MLQAPSAHVAEVQRFPSWSHTQTPQVVWSLAWCLAAAWDTSSFRPAAVPSASAGQLQYLQAVLVSHRLQVLVRDLLVDISRHAPDFAMETLAGHLLSETTNLEMTTVGLECLLAVLLTPPTYAPVRCLCISPLSSPHECRFLATSHIRLEAAVNLLCITPDLQVHRQPNRLGGVARCKPLHRAWPDCT